MNLKKTTLFIFKLLCFILILSSLNSCNNKKDVPEAETDLLALLNAKIKKDPKNPDLYYQQAKVYFDQDRVNDARSSCLYAIELNNETPDYYLLLADIELKSGRYDESVKAIQRIFEIDPNNLKAHLKQAELSLFAKDYKRVTEETQKVLDVDNLNSTAYFLRGFAAKEQGDTFSAVRNYKKTIELDPENAVAYEELGILYAMRKDKSTVDYLNSAINLNPRNTIAMYVLAMYYQDTEQPEKAMEIYENILTVDPKHTNALHNMGYIEMVDKENYSQAVTYFTKAIEADSTFAEAYYNRAYTYELMNNKKLAVEGYEKVLSINPENKKAQDHLKKLK